MIAHLKGREKALQALGWTGGNAEWIALVCLHSGVFTRAQLMGWLGIDRWKALRFVRVMTERRVADERTLQGRKVCRIYARPVYRALGAEHIRHRRAASTEVLMRRLLSLDYVIDHPGLPWLPTEDEKVAAFEGLGLERALLPVKVYRGGTGTTRRRFPVKLPIALDAERVVFVYVDPGHDTSTGLRSWAAAHRALWDAIRGRGRSVEVVGVVRTRGGLRRARRMLGHWVGRSTASGPSPAPETSGPTMDEIVRIEQAIRGNDEALVEELGGLQGCLVRIVELKERLKSARPGATIDGFAVWCSTRLPGGVS